MPSHFLRLDKKQNTKKSDLEQYLKLYRMDERQNPTACIESRNYKQRLYVLKNLKHVYNLLLINFVQLADGLHRRENNKANRRLHCKDLPAYLI